MLNFKILIPIANSPNQFRGVKSKCTKRLRRGANFNRGLSTTIHNIKGPSVVSVPKVSYLIIHYTPPSYVCGQRAMATRLEKGIEWLCWILTLVICSLIAKHILYANILPTFGWKGEIATIHFTGSATCYENKYGGVYFSFSLDETTLSSTGSLFGLKKELTDICDQLNVLFPKSIIYYNAPFGIVDNPDFVVLPICHLTNIVVAVAGPECLHPIRCSRYRGLRRKVRDAVCARITEIKWKRTFTIGIHLDDPVFETEVHEKADKGANHNDNYARCRQRNGPSALQTFFKPSVNDNTMQCPQIDFNFVA